MQTRECLVSVLCTAYNHEKYIRQTLQSFVDQQTDFAFEVLVNDDKSTDGTAAIIREFEEKYPDIIRAFYQEENLYSQHINVYVTDFYPKVRGKYIAYCEGDDYWTDMTKLQRQVDFLESHPEYSGCVHGMLVTNPIPEEYAMDKEVIDRAIEQALRELDENGIHGKECTPFLLAKVVELTGGDSLESNIQLVLNNARLAAQTAALIG